MGIKGQRTTAGEKTRKEILDAALTLLGRGGSDAVSAGALAREAKVSKATIFHHFESVDKMLLAAFDWRQSLETEDHGSTSARVYLDDLGQQLVRAASEDPTLLKAQAAFITRAIFDRDTNARLAEGVSDTQRLVTDALRVRLAEDTAPDEVESIAQIIAMALDGLMINLVTRTDDGAQLARTWTRMVDVLLTTVQAPANRLNAGR